jgi:hypothetical protein
MDNSKTDDPNKNLTISWITGVKGARFPRHIIFFSIVVLPVKP